MTAGIGQKIIDGENLVITVDAPFQKVTGNSREVGELIAAVTVASEEQSQGIDQVNRAIAEMNRLTRQNAACAQDPAYTMALFKTNEFARQEGFVRMISREVRKV